MAPRFSPARFLIRFVLIWLAGLLALALVPPLEEGMAGVTARQLEALLPFLGMQPARDGTTLHIDHATMDIEPICSPAPGIVALFAAILAYPAAPLSRLAGMAAGAAILWGYNLLRLAILALLMVGRSPWFDFFHIYLWQAVTIAIAGALFFAWIRLLGWRSVRKPTAA